MDSLTIEDVNELYQKYFPIVRAKCQRMVRSPDVAQDIAQEAFSRLLENRNQIENPRVAIYWIYRTCTRLVVDLYRKKKHTVAIEFVDEIVSSVSDPESQIHAQKLLQLIGKKCPKDELAVAILIRLDGLNQEEVGKVLQVSERTVRRWLLNLDKRLKKIVSEAKS